jgi:hypothetical protein
MGKQRERTSRGSGKNKKKKHTRTIWAGVEREVRRKEWDEAQKVQSATESNPAESGTTTQHGDSATASSSAAPVG